MPILQPKPNTPASKVISLRISGTLHSQLEAVRKQADDVGLVFDVNTLFTSTLQRALKQAQSELAGR